WRSVVDGPDPLIGPRALDPAIDLSDTLRTVEVDVSADVTAVLLADLPRLTGGGVNDGLLTALALALVRRRGSAETSALIRLEGHGRQEDVVPGADLSRTVGWFTSLYPVRLALTGIDLDEAYAGGHAMGAALRAVERTLRAVPDRKSVV